MNISESARDDIARTQLLMVHGILKLPYHDHDLERRPSFLSDAQTEELKKIVARARSPEHRTLMFRIHIAGISLCGVGLTSAGLMGAKLVEAPINFGLLAFASIGSFVASALLNDTIDKRVVKGAREADAKLAGEAYTKRKWANYQRGIQKRVRSAIKDNQDVRIARKAAVERKSPSESQSFFRGDIRLVDGQLLPEIVEAVQAITLNKATSPKEHFRASYRLGRIATQSNTEFLREALAQALMDAQSLRVAAAPMPQPTP